METDRQKEAERLYCRLMSSDPDFNDCTDAANFIRAAAIDLKGPDGFESWQDAAVSERIRRVKAEAELAELRRTQPEATKPAPIPGLPFADLATPIKEFEARKAAALASPADALVAGDRVEGDLLPPIGSKVLIHLSRQDAWVEHTVTGYYVWGDLGGNKSLHRVFVRVVDADGFDNARLLEDVRAIQAQKDGHG